jgi:hypothetical protein
MVTVPVGEDTQEAQQLPQNDDHDNDHEEKEEEEGNMAEGEDDEDYTPLSGAEKEEMFYDAVKIKIAGNEAPIPIGRLRDLLNHPNITTYPEFRIKRVLHPGREEYKAIMEIFSGPNVLSCHKGPAFRATYQDEVEVEGSLLKRWVSHYALASVWRRGEREEHMHARACSPHLVGPAWCGEVRRWAWVHDVHMNSPPKFGTKPHRSAASFCHLFLVRVHV